MADTQLNLTQAAKAAGITRKTLYTHIQKGKVTTSRDAEGNRVIDVSELIRAYRDVSLPVEELPRKKHPHITQEGKQSDAVSEQLAKLQKEMAEMKASIVLMLEDKSAREDERRQFQEERERLQLELQEARQQLEAINSKGFWSRVFNK